MRAPSEHQRASRLLEIAPPGPSPSQILGTLSRFSSTSTLKNYHPEDPEHSGSRRIESPFEECHIFDVVFLCRFFGPSWETSTPQILLPKKHCQAWTRNNRTSQESLAKGTSKSRKGVGVLIRYNSPSSPQTWVYWHWSLLDYTQQMTRRSQQVTLPGIY